MIGWLYVLKPKTIESVIVVSFYPILEPDACNEPVRFAEKPWLKVLFADLS
jgi:hypothetical protein